MGAPKKLIAEEALTFDDVIIVPTRTSVLPHEPSLETTLVKGITLKTPFVSSPMKTVTEYDLAIKIAQFGGIGIIHRDLSAQEQADQVRRVKRYEAFLVERPTVIPLNSREGSTTQPTRVIEALALREARGYSTFPVVDDRGNLVGIITDKDLRWRAPKDKIGDIMVEDVVTVPYQDNEERLRQNAIAAMRDNRVGSVVVTKSKKSRKIYGIATETDIKKRDLYPDATRDKKGRLRVGAAIGVGDAEFDRVDKLYDAEADVLVVDVSHGHCKSELDTLKALKKNYDIPIIAGNIVTKEAVEELAPHSDAFRVGIGPGSTCTTRVVIGIGMPQLTAIIETAEAAHKEGIPVMADGGIKFPGDAAKAIAAGADTVMIGRLFAGTGEAPGEIVLKDGRTYKKHMGMASEEVLKSKKGGGKSRYLESSDAQAVFPQGIEGYVEYAGPLEMSVTQLCEGVKKAMSAVNSRSIGEYHEAATLRRVSSSGSSEGHPSIVLETEPVNYRQMR